MKIKNSDHKGGGPFVYISNFFTGVKVKFFRFISKQIPDLVTLNTLILESIKISLELKVYFSMKIKHGTLFISDFFEGVKVKFFALYQNQYRIWSL